MKFFLNIEPPTATAQMKKVSVINGRPVFYEPSSVKEAKRLLLRSLIQYAPASPLSRPLALHAIWLYPAGKSHKAGTWRVTRPDTDNIEKLLKDCMTKCGFWKDDAQVVKETVEKRWSDEPTGIEIEITELNAGSMDVSAPDTDLPVGLDSAEREATVAEAELQDAIVATAANNATGSEVAP